MEADRRLRFRWLARLKAWALGYFFLPCPLCGQMFAGYEWDDGYIQRYQKSKTDITHGRGICPAHKIRDWVEKEPGVYVPGTPW